MLGSAFTSARSAIAGAETALQVSAHNLANLQTDGFKAARVRFADARSESIAAAPAGSAPAVQVGLGTHIASIDTDPSTGTIAPDWDPRSFAIVGAGYFVLGDRAGQLAFSRDGHFRWNAAGELIHSSGLLVMGDPLDQSSPSGNGLAPFRLRPGMLTPSGPNGVRVDQQGRVVALGPDGTARQLGSLSLAHFPNPQGLVARGDNLQSAGPNAGSPQFSRPGSGELRAKSRELSNTDVASELVVLLMAASMVQANVPVVHVSNELLKEVSSLLAS